MPNPTTVPREERASCTNEMSLPDASLVATRIQEVMSSQMGSSLADVILITSDNVRVPAVRVLLSMNSSYFHRLFSSEFAEKNLSEVPVSITSVLLVELLEFIHTDDCTRLRTIRQNLKKSMAISCKDVQGLVDLADAADYTHMARLVSRCEEGVKCVMSSAPHTASGALVALARGRLSWGQELLQEAVKINVRKMDQALIEKYDGCDLTCGLLHLDAEGVEFVFASARTKEQQQEKLFQVLVLWACGGNALLLQRKRCSWSDSEIIIDTGNIQVMEDRLEPAKRIADWLQISCFKLGFLQNIVEESGLVSNQVLCAAYKRQASVLEMTLKYKDEEISTAEQEVKKVRRELATTSEELRQARAHIEFKKWRDHE